MTINIYNFETPGFTPGTVTSTTQPIVQIGSYKTPTDPVVTEKHFGGIYTTYTTVSNFEKSHENAGHQASFIRWPDGGRAETADYSLTHPDLFWVDGSDEGKGLSEMLAYANNLGQSFSMILPTRKYADDLGKCEADLKQFLIKLFAGEYGTLPADLTLEIGNETFSMGWEGTKYSSKGSYGQVANTMLETIDEIASSNRYNPHGHEITVAVQSGTNSPRTIIGEIEPKNLDRIDQIVSHHLESNIDDFGFSDIQNAHKIWSAVLGRDIDQNMSAWNVGKPVHTYDPKDPFDVSGIDTNALQFNSIGARQAGETIEAITSFVALGVDALSVWGTVKHENSYFWHTDHGSLEKTSHGGEALKLMAESLVGKSVLSGSFVDGERSKNQETTNYQNFSFGDRDEKVVFLTAHDIKNSGQTVTVSLGTQTTAEYVWADVIRTEIPDQFLEFKGTDYQRLFEVPIVSRMELAVSDGEIVYHFKQDYEVARIIIPTDGKTNLPPDVTEPEPETLGTQPTALAKKSSCDESGFLGSAAIAIAVTGLPDAFEFTETIEAVSPDLEITTPVVELNDDPLLNAFGSSVTIAGASAGQEAQIVACLPKDLCTMDEVA